MLKNAFFVFFYSLAAMVCVMLFVFLQGPVKYVFSLSGIGIVIYYFRSFETRGMRIGFIISAFVLFFVLNVVFVIIYLANDWKIPSVTE